MKMRNAFSGKRFTHRMVFYLWDRANAIAQVFTAIGRFFFSASQITQIIVPQSVHHNFWEALQHFSRVCLNYVLK